MRCYAGTLTVSVSEWGDLAAAYLISQQTRYVEPDVGLILGKRRGRWANIKPALVQRLVFTGIRSSKL